MSTIVSRRGTDDFRDGPHLAVDKELAQECPALTEHVGQPLVWRLRLSPEGDPSGKVEAVVLMTGNKLATVYAEGRAVIAHRGADVCTVSGSGTSVCASPACEILNTTAALCIGQLR